MAFDNGNCTCGPWSWSVLPPPPCPIHPGTWYQHTSPTYTWPTTFHPVLGEVRPPYVGRHRSFTRFWPEA